jgi:hypothetical protein
LNAANALTRYLEPDASRLADLLLDSTPGTFPVVLNALVRHREESVSVLRGQLSDRREHLSESGHVRGEQRRAMAAIGLLLLGAQEDFWQALASHDDPDFLTAVIDRCAPFGVNAETLLSRLDIESQPAVKHVAVLSLAEYLVPPMEPATELRAAIQDKCRSLHEKDPDSGVHFAAEWILRRHAPGELLSPAGGSGRSGARRANDPAANWQVTRDGISLVIVRGPQEFTIGSPESETEREGNLESEQPVNLDYSFAIGAYEVTVEQYQRLMPEKQYASVVTDTTQAPMSNISWYDAVKFCRRLSETEGLPESEMVYPSIENIGSEMQLPSNWRERTGYRLPTEEEWECACRAGTRTSRFF